MMKKMIPRQPETKRRPIKPRRTFFGLRVHLDMNQIPGMVVSQQ